MARDEVEVRHMGMNCMWDGSNAKRVQGQLFQVFYHENVGISVGHDNKVERRRTHPILLSTAKMAGLSELNFQVLGDIKVRGGTKKDKGLSTSPVNGILLSKYIVSSQLRYKPLK